MQSGLVFLLRRCFFVVVAMGSDASPAVELAAVDSDGIRLRGAFPRAGALGQSESPGPGTRPHLDLGLLHR